MRASWPLPKSASAMALFVMHALVVGSIFSRIAEIQFALDLSEAVFGLVLTGMPTGVFLGSPLVSPIIERFGTRRALLCGYPAFAACPLIVSLAPGPVALYAALFLHGLALTVCNITMNVEADRVEAQEGVRIMNRCHGAWGVGLFTAYSAGAGAIAAGIAPTWYFIGLLAVTILAAVLFVRPMTESAPRRHAGNMKARRFAMPTLATVLIILYAAFGSWLEGVARNWSVIYLRDDFGAAAWIAALTLPAVASTQTIGRFIADGLIDRFGPVAVARALTIAGLVGLALVTFATSIWLALCGFVLIGLGISTVYPQSVSAAARWGDRPASENVAAFATLQTLISYIGSPVIGLVAERHGLRASLMMVLPMALLALYFARYLGKRGDDSSAGAAAKR
jgi:MFS family permease